VKALAASGLAEHWRRLADSDLYYSFRRSRVTVGAAVVTGIFVLSAVFAPWIAPHDPYDLTTLSLLDAFAPPVWFEDGTWDFMLGTDDQGRGMLSAIIY
jgi:peptide/nickel transport system permease protein